MDRADELTVLRVIVDAVATGEYEQAPEDWQRLARMVAAHRALFPYAGRMANSGVVSRACVASDMEIG